MKYYYLESTFFNLETLIATIIQLDSYSNYFSIHIISTVSSLIDKTIKTIQKKFSDQGLVIQKIEIFDAMQQNFLTNIYPGLGADRVAKLTGALKLNPNKNLILIDFGTATTMSIASSKKKFLGGFISLGFRASLKALNNNCDALEDYSDKVNDLNLLSNPDTKNSQEAIIYGSYSAHIGLIQEWIKEASSVLKDKLTICTGGDARFFTKYFDQYIDDKILLEAALAEDFTKV